MGGNKKMKSQWFFIGITLLAIMFPLAVTLARDLEVRLFPIIDPPIEITESQVFDKDKNLIYVTFGKKRSCEFITIKWFTGNDVEIGFEFREELSDDFAGGLTRPVGPHETGPWLVYSRDMDNVYAKSYHHCHPFWITESIIYEGKNIF